MADSLVSMIYGNNDEYTFSCVPLLNMSLNNIRNEDGKCLCYTYRGTFTGTLVRRNSTEDHVLDQKRELEEALRCGEDCQRLRLFCTDEDDNEIEILDIFPRILSVNFDQGEDNWCFTIPYTIELEWSQDGFTDEVEAAECVRDTNDTWSFEIIDEAIKMQFIDTPDPPPDPPETVDENCEPYISTAGDYDFDYSEDTEQDATSFYADAEITCPEPTIREVYYTRIQINHEVGATGISACVYDQATDDNDDPNGEPDLNTIKCVPGWERAKIWVDARLGTKDVDFTAPETGEPSTGDPEIPQAGFPCNGGDTPSIQDYQRRNYVVSKTFNKEDGSYSATESWEVLIFDSEFNHPDFEADPDELNDLFKASEEYSVEIDSSCNGQPTSVAISGTITGLGEVEYCPFEVIESKIDNAKDYWEKIQPILYCRAQECYEGGCKLHPKPVQDTLAIRENAGVLNYSVTYNDRPISFIPGACVERISFNDTLPAQSITEQPVLGRKRGPVLQPLNTTNARCRTMNMEVIMDRLDFDVCADPPEDGCIVNCAGLGYTTREANILVHSAPKDSADKFVCCQQKELEELYQAVFRTQDAETWDPINRRYTRTVRWCFEDCNSPEIDNFSCDN